MNIKTDLAKDLLLFVVLMGLLVFAVAEVAHAAEPLTLDQAIDGCGG